MDVNRLMSGAVEAHERGRLADAREAYDRILAGVPDQPDALAYRGLLRHQTGDLPGAAEDLAAAVSARPRDLTFRFNLAEVLRETGRHEDALPHYRKIVDAAPGDGDARFGLANTLFELGDHPEAVRQYQAAARAIPDDPEIWNNLGNALIASGELEAAADSYAKALDRDPGYADAMANMAGAFEGLRRTGDAEQAWLQADALYRQKLAGDPEDVLALAGLARVCLARGDNREAMGALLKAGDLAPDDPAVQAMLGRVYATIPKFAEAGMHFRRALDAEPGNLLVQIEFAEVQLETGHRDDAVEILTSILSADPDNDAALEGLGSVALREGRFDEAAGHFRRALAISPGLGLAWHGLGASKLMTGAEFETLSEMAREEHVPPDDRQHMHFALGDFADREGDYDTAFAHFRSGNDFRRSHFDADAWRRDVDQTIGVFDREFFAARQDFGTDSDLPVFIVGMPRSGTTLTEQIISSHPSVHGAGELYAMQELIGSIRSRLGGKDLDASLYSEILQADSRSFGEQHVEALRILGPDALRVTDKLPGNFIRLGIIALLMPNAGIIHTSRNAIDTCLSCYFQNFRRLEFSFDLESIAAYYRDYRRYMSHWREVLPLRILDIRYEDLIVDQETESRRLIDSLGLEWDDACLSFHKTDRPIATASVWQARQPVYKTSVARWKRYEKHLGPLIEALGEYADE